MIKNDFDWAPRLADIEFEYYGQKYSLEIGYVEYKKELYGRLWKDDSFIGGTWFNDFLFLDAPSTVIEKCLDIKNRFEKIKAFA